MKYGISFRDPTGETASTLRERVAPLDKISGKTIALMDIGKMRGDEFIDSPRATLHGAWNQDAPVQEAH
jgi:hypothetical protein